MVCASQDPSPVEGLGYKSWHNDHLPQYFTIISRASARMESEVDTMPFCVNILP